MKGANMPRRKVYLTVTLLAAVLVVVASLFVALATLTPTTQARSVESLPAPPGKQPDFLSQMTQDMKVNHGKYDNVLTALYERWLAGEDASGKSTGAGNGNSSPNKAFSPLYGPDVRMSNGNVLGSNQNEFQIDVNPADGNFAIGTSNDAQTAGVGIFRTTDGGQTWTSRDASFYGVQAACCDPGVAYGSDGKVYAIILDTSPAATYILRSTDNGATWQGPTQVSTPDRPNIVVDPSNSNIVYVTYTDFNQPAGRIAGYKSTDGGVTWGSSFLIGDPISSPGYQQSSQPRVASNGWIYVGYQEYNDQNVGCSAGVRNEVARSTDGGATWNITELNIVQGGACSTAQAGRGIFCVNSGVSVFRSRSHPIMGVSPTNPSHVYMIYSGGDLEPTGTYVCGGGTGNHSDTLFRLSTDAGATWTAPTKINTDPDGANKDQYLPWMSVSANGRIWVGWNDRRDDANDYLSKWYQSYSDDEGTTWRAISGAPGNDVVADVQTQPSTFIGDYHGLGATSGNNAHVLPMWFDSRNATNGDAYTDPQVPLQGTPTRTVTGTPPTATRTPTATPTVCGGSANYSIATATGTIVPATTDTGNHTDDGTTFISLPFAYTVYDQTFTGANLSSNGNLQFVSNSTLLTNVCLPTATFSFPIMPHWDDLRTDQIGSGCTAYGGVGCGIFTSISGTAPNRIFDIEWRTVYFGANTTRANFEVRLYEGQRRFDIIYGEVAQGGSSATVGVQKDTGSFFTQFECNTAGTLTLGLDLIFTEPPCATPVPLTSTPTLTTTPTPTATSCGISFTDVHPADYFYTPVLYLACRGVVSGYNTSPPCAPGGTPCFNPFGNTTRSQMVKIVVLGFNVPISTPTAGAHTFTDVTPDNPFFFAVETAAGNNIVSGYGCGGPGEPCDDQNRPYFRPYANVTRGQLSKIDVIAAGWPLVTTPPPGTFEDVLPSNVFYDYIETAYCHGIISGYECGGAGEPCDPGNRPYFRWYNDAIRGQIAKIVYLSITNTSSCASAR
jgi:hypothetical protein